MTTHQPEIPFPTYDHQDTIQGHFEQFHRANPFVYSELVRRARRLKRRGWKKAGIGMLWEVLRWRMMLSTKTADGFKLNNNFRSRYARLIMEENDDLDGFFETRELRAH